MKFLVTYELGEGGTSMTHTIFETEYNLRTQEGIEAFIERSLDRFVELNPQVDRDGAFFLIRLLFPLEG